MTKAIDIVDLCKTFRGHWRKREVLAVDHVSLSVEAGEAFGFVGPNGAGKSTTIRMLTGVLKPSAGKAELFGVSIDNPQARRGVGYVPESPYLYEYLTPMEILSMSMQLHDVQVDNPQAHCLQWLERLELGAVSRKTLRSFSKGMTQRVALAQALCIRPRLLILDEPLSGLDPLGRRDVVDILSEYKKSGGTLFFTSHVLHDVERLADRFGFIHRSQLKAIKSPQDLVEEEELVTVRVVGREPPAGFVGETGERWFAEVPRSQLWAVLQSVQASGHMLLEIKPTLTLERVFMRFVSEDAVA